MSDHAVCADKSMEEVISEFIVCTCQLLPKAYNFSSDSKLTQIMSESPTQMWSLLCGSTAELCIQALNSCVTDYDCLKFCGDQLAFTDDVPVMVNDVSSLFDKIECYKIESYYRYPSFVRLQFLGEMDYNWNCKQYEFKPASVFWQKYGMQKMLSAANRLTGRFNAFTEILSGPAVKCKLKPESITYDLVRGIRCFQWPMEAQEWPKRLRDYAWPTIDIITEVVQHGCHVVYAQHRSCRNDKLQWRLSFSFAEVILLQSWSQIQQICYHLFRFFAKRELIQEHCPKEDEVICTYHIKTLMLWTCEEMPPEWWNSSSVILICCELLQKLSEYLAVGFCPNYFIPEANLFNEHSSPAILNNIKRRLKEFHNSHILSQWFLENYIQPLISKLFKNVTTCNLNLMPNVVYYMSQITDCRKAIIPNSLDFLFSLGFLSGNMYTLKMTAGLRSGQSGLLKCAWVFKKGMILTNSTKSVLQPAEDIWCFTYYDITLYALSVRNSLVCGNMSWDSELFAECVKAISLQPKMVLCQYHIFPKPSTAARSQVNLILAQDLMENLTGSNSRSAFQVVSILVKAFLRKALECDDYQHNGFVLAALVYLAALYFATSEYQIVEDLCSAVLMDQITYVEKETLNAGCLFFIDDVVRIVGFCLLFVKCRDNVRYNKRKKIFLDLRFTPEVFAYYLTVSSVNLFSMDLQLYRKFIALALPLDLLLLVLIKRKCCTWVKSGVSLKSVRHCIYRRMNSLIAKISSWVNILRVKSKVIDALKECALENMASFYRGIQDNFGFQCDTADCYRALYLYKCRQYDEVLLLCDRILRDPDLQNDLKEFGFANMLILPPLDAYFDEDVQSLLGFHTLFYYLNPLNDDLMNIKMPAMSTSFAHFFARFVYFGKGSLSDSLHCSCFIKCHYFIGRHFLARYLKLRCATSCNQPCTEALAELYGSRCSLPFEHIIRLYCLRKLRTFKNDPSISSCS